MWPSACRKSFFGTLWGCWERFWISFSCELCCTSSKHISYRTKQSFVTILHMFFLFPKNHLIFWKPFLTEQKTKSTNSEAVYRHKLKFLLFILRSWKRIQYNSRAFYSIINAKRKRDGRNTRLFPSLSITNYRRTGTQNGCGSVLSVHTL